MLVQAVDLQNLLFDTDFGGMDCRGKAGFKKDFDVKKIDATGAKAQIYAPKSNRCAHIGQMKTQLLDLAEFANVRTTGKMNIQGQHTFGNFHATKTAETNVLDHKDGLVSHFKNATNEGKMRISGNHKFDNFTNSGSTEVLPAGMFAAPKLELMDLA